MARRTVILRGVLAMALAGSLLLVGVGSVSAASPVTPGSGTPAGQSVSVGTHAITYSPASVSVVTKSTVHLDVSAGRCGTWGLWVCIYLSHTDQIYLAAGAIAFVTVLICGATALIGCAAASALAAAAALYVSRHGICSGGRRLRAQVQYSGGFAFECVS
jgi:hypothetical protein